ncbi:MAG: beta-propeller fold lactonase family protein [Actinomycetota bacterium]|nr:beta-propeller fold lactonase family protein [Actinomycetota bacterium]
MTAVGVACTGATSRTSDTPTTAPSTPHGSSAPITAPEAAALAVRSAGYGLIAPIQRSVAVWDGDVIYIAGGLDAADTTVGGVFSMNPASGRLTPLGSLAQPVHDAAAAMITGKLFVFAGGAGSGTDTVQAFDPATGTGSVVGHLPVALSDLAAAQIGTTTYLVGGYDGTRPRSEIYATTDGTSYSMVGHLPVGLRYPAVTEVGGRLVIAGGQASSGPVNDVYTFDPSSGATTLTAHLPSPIAHAAAFTLGGRIYVVGGRDASDTALARASEIDPSTWHVEAEPPLGQPIADAAVAAGRRILLIGGWNTSTSSKVLRASLRAETAPAASQGNGASASSRSGGNVYAAITRNRLRPSVANDPSFVYVPNGLPGTVEVIDPKTFRIVRTIDLGYRSFPEHVTPSWNMRWLYVDVDGTNELAVIDPRTGKLARIIHGVEHPYNLYFTPDGSKAIDVAEYYDRLDFMDPHTWKLIKPLTMPCNGPDHLDFSADGSYLLIGCEFDGTVVKVALKTMRVVGTIHVGGLPVDVKLSPNGKVFFVANQGLGGVSVVDPVSMTVRGFIPTGNGAHGMAISRDTTKLYVTNRLAGTISVIDFSKRAVVHTWNVGGSPDMVQVTPNGSQIWVSNRYGTTVEAISTADGHVIRRIEVGGDPHGLAYFPQPGRFSLGHNGVYR